MYEAQGVSVSIQRVPQLKTKQAMCATKTPLAQTCKKHVLIRLDMLSLKTFELSSSQLIFSLAVSPHPRKYCKLGSPVKFCSFFASLVFLVASNPPFVPCLLVQVIIRSRTSPRAVLNVWFVCETTQIPGWSFCRQILANVPTPWRAQPALDPLQIRLKVQLVRSGYCISQSIIKQKNTSIYLVYLILYIWLKSQATLLLGQALLSTSSD